MEGIRDKALLGCGDRQPGWREPARAQGARRGRGQISVLGKLAARHQRSLHRGHIGCVTLANKHMKPGVVGELEFDSMTAVTGAGLRRTHQIHLTNAGKNIGHFGSTPTKHNNRLKRFSRGQSVPNPRPPVKQLLRGKLGNRSTKGLVPAGVMMAQRATLQNAHFGK